MKIKSIEITGFKSFVERTTLTFDEGVTSIVGPNGCGKSNVVDAIRWVMGEQSAKNLRGKAMEDVIFGGSESRKPLGMAEVSLIMDNSSGLAPAAYREYSEIQITRRLFRNGDSDYLLNRTPCRLLDITELFMDTGVGTRAYSIIEQGKIGMIINAKPEERRSLIEEAAGVTKFKSRKKAALRKIDATRQNLVRLGDIVAEVRRQMNSLKRQAQRAEKFREYREELKGIELQFALRQHASLTERLATASRSADGSGEQLENFGRRVEQAELDLEQARLLHAEREKTTANGQQRVFHLTSDIQKNESNLEYGTREQDALERQRERIAAELADIGARLEAAAAEEQGLQDVQSVLSLDLTAEQQALEATEEQLADLVEQERQLVVELEAARNRLYVLLTDLSRMSGQHDEANRRLQSLAELSERNRQEAVAVRAQMDRLQADSNALTDSLVEVKGDRDQLSASRLQLQQRLVELRQGLEETENRLLVEREELNRQRSRLESLQQLEQRLEGYGRGVKLLLSDPEQKTRFRGMVADVLEVPAQVEVAVEAVLGDRLQALLPNRSEDARAALGLLSQGDGRCTFLLPEFAPAAPPALPGATHLPDLVKAQEGIPALVGRLLAGVFLVDSLDPYLAGGVPVGATLVTADGELLSCRGEMTGGGRRSLDQGLLHKKREMKDLGDGVRRLDKQVAALNSQRESLRGDLVATESQLRTTEASLHQQELRVVDNEKDLAGLQQELGRLQERLELLCLEEEQHHEEHETLQRTRQDAEQSRMAGESAKAGQEAVVSRLQAETQQLRTLTEEVRHQLTARKVALASMREREENTRGTLERIARLREELHLRQRKLEQDRAESLARQEQLGQSAERLRLELEVLFKRRLEEQAVLDALRDQFEASRQDIDQREAALKQLRAQTGQSREELAALQLQCRELDLECEHLCQTFLERFRVDLAAAETAALFDAEFDQAAAAGRRELLQRRIDEIGEVNLTAIDEYQELEERYIFLTSQQDDLQQSLEGLQAAIHKINRTTRKRFQETFEQVNAKFREVFPRLFNGGQAELRLTDEADLLETGVEIVSQPPGKKLQNVSLLSGGEKALTAVALIFSIFMIKPSPFCLLDEVDAPLDEVNIGRFNEIVRQMSASSQFIIITHNKRTMEIADNLYGITMEEPGISKLVSVKMKEVA